MLYSTRLCSALLWSTLLCCTLLYCTVLCCIALHCAVPCYAVQKLVMRNITKLHLTFSSNFSPIIIPLQSSLTVTLPTTHDLNKKHYPFPDSQPTFVGFEDKVCIGRVEFCRVKIRFVTEERNFVKYVY